MKLLASIAKKISNVLKLDIIKTFYINFKMLPFSMAVHLPIYIYKKTKFRDLSGKIKINSPLIYRGMIKIGKNDYYVRTSVSLTYWIVCGSIEFTGPFNFLNGGYLLSATNSSLIFGSGGFIGSDYKIICFENIKFGNNLMIAWEFQIFDTSFHYISYNGQPPGKLTKPVIIGDYAWIGNRVTICNGVNLPPFTIVAQCSLVNKNFQIYDEPILLAGVPAKLKGVGFKYIYNQDEQSKLDLLYKYNRTHL